ncbi:IS66 family insertion sequence element accessory protein TnpB [Salegentibacter sp. LM13S]|uniref:IS66 family insertion sequence element accessory protein TnpB n=1 Tax=Salegentibacter lacus TaxID=2873599 RepID=UPI001CCB8BE7|nr:IS66 family insertion sequence element accessory protein TnpB [Salegentibacter lacus]MBZ9632673.1 IS66 family insertion sequence element accessory protein TnpB [Salegentibacter lacus]
MFSLGSSHNYHFYRKSCDMRKSFNGLSGLVKNELNREPTSGDVFVFLNRNRTHLKLLHWERGGFVLYYKRLERGSFTPPAIKEDQTSFTWPQLVLMIEGIKVEKSVQKLRYSH